MNATEKKYVEKLKEYIEEILKYKFVIPMDMYDKFESEISALEQQINNLKGDYGHDPSITSFDTKYPMRSESKTAKTAEEILLKHIGKAYNCRSVFHNRYIAAMEEYRQQHQKESKYCDCEQPDREIGYSYCHTCHRMVSDERIELILNQGSTAQQPQKVEQEVFQICRNGNKTDIYLNGNLIQPDSKYGIPLTMEQCDKLMKIKEYYNHLYFKSVEQEEESLTDEEIEKWARSVRIDFGTELLIEGAKAMRDNPQQFKSNNN
jgi:hypothetical protein